MRLDGTGDWSRTDFEWDSLTPFSISPSSLLCPAVRIAPNWVGDSLPGARREGWLGTLLLRRDMDADRQRRAHGRAPMQMPATGIASW